MIKLTIYSKPFLSLAHFYAPNVFLSDYAGGNRFSIEFEESSKKYEDLVESLECESRHRQTLIGILQDGDAYYDAAFKEATIIANVC